MIRTIILAAVLLAAGPVAAAQGKEYTLVRTPAGWAIPHPVQEGQTLFSLARLYAVPPAVLADANGLTYADRVRAGDTLRIPLGSYNRRYIRPVAGMPECALRYGIARGETLAALAREAGVTQKMLMEWNGLDTPGLHSGQVLTLGWLRCGGEETAVPTRDIAADVLPGTDADLVEAPPGSAVPRNALEEAWLLATDEGRSAVTERGTAAFFPGAASARSGALYAFHNSAARGSVVRVANIGTGRAVYVKVLGPLPSTKTYAGAIIGLSAAARSALGVRGDARMWCEISYAGY